MLKSVFSSVTTQGHLPSGCHSYLAVAVTALCWPPWPLVRFRPQDKCSEASPVPGKMAAGNWGGGSFATCWKVTAWEGRGDRTGLLPFYVSVVLRCGALSHPATPPCAVLFARGRNSEEGGVPLQREGLRGRGALGHRQLHALLLPAGPDPLLHRQLPPAALRGAHQRGRKLLPDVSRYLSQGSRAVTAIAGETGRWCTGPGQAVGPAQVIRRKDGAGGGGRPERLPSG